MLINALWGLWVIICGHFWFSLFIYCGSGYNMFDTIKSFIFRSLVCRCDLYYIHYSLLTSQQKMLPSKAKFNTHSFLTTGCYYFLLSLNLWWCKYGLNLKVIINLESMSIRIWIRMFQLNQARKEGDKSFSVFCKEFMWWRLESG